VFRAFILKRLGFRFRVQRREFKVYSLGLSFSFPGLKVQGVEHRDLGNVGRAFKMPSKAIVHGVVLVSADMKTLTFNRKSLTSLP
jgi:hypothetical protein